MTPSFTESTFMSIRRVEERDLPAIAAIHKSQMRTGFLEQYSLRLIASFYRAFMNSLVFSVHETARGVDGFVVGGMSARYDLRRRNFVLINLWPGAWETLLRPRLWFEGPRRALRSFAAFRPKHGRPAEPETVPSFGIMAIAVAEEAKGTGVGAALINAFERVVRDRTTTYSVSVERHNLRAIRFYEKMGFELKEDVGRAFVYRKSLRRPDEGAPATRGAP